MNWYCKQKKWWCEFQQDTEEDIAVMEEALKIRRPQLTDRKWSVIIPTMNEEDNILYTLGLVCKVFTGGVGRDKMMLTEYQRGWKE